MEKIIALSTFAVMVNAHGGLTFPPPRNNYRNQDPTVRVNPNTFHGNGAFCTGDECLWFNEGCWIGCPTNCSSKMPANNPKAKGYEKMQEFTWNTYGEPNCPNWKPMEPTLPDKFRTYNLHNESAFGDFTKYHPWRAPGHSPTVDPCGMGGAYILAKEGGIAPQGSSLFARGSALPVGVRTKWAARDVVEVGWMVGSNHGGGYLYSLCPSGEPLTEECFQMGTLPFVGDTHTIRYLDNKTEFTIPAMDVNEGTWPAGSAWRRNPIPACNCDQGDECVYDSAADLVRAYANDGPPHPKGDAVATGNDCPFGTQFPVPFPYGYGQHLWYNSEDGPSRDMWAIVDKVQLPNITGDYVLRWRWDTEQNPQIWSHCADVRIV